MWNIKLMHYVLLKHYFFLDKKAIEYIKFNKEELQSSISSKPRGGVTTAAKIKSKFKL